MTILVDTSVLARLCNSADASHPLAMRAVVNLHAAGEDLRLTPQVLIEFRCIATRPTGANGLGLASAEADARTAAFEELLPLLADTEEVFPAWKEIVSSLGIIGKQVHDARLAACTAFRSFSRSIPHISPDWLPPSRD